MSKGLGHLASGAVAGKVEPAAVIGSGGLKMVEASDNGRAGSGGGGEDQGAVGIAEGAAVVFQVLMQVPDVVDAAFQCMIRIGVGVDADEEGVEGGHLLMMNDEFAVQN